MNDTRGEIVKDHRIPSVAATRIGLLVGVPLCVVVGIHAVSWAEVTLKNWNSGDTLTASDLNANFAALQSLSVRKQDAAFAVTPVTFTGSYANVFPAYTFNAPTTRDYIVHIDVDQAFTALAAGPRGVSNYQLVVNGVAFRAFAIEGNDVQLRWRGSGRVVVNMNAGNNTIQLQAQNGGSLGTGMIDTTSQRVFTIE